MKRKSGFLRFARILLKPETLVAVSILAVTALIFYASRDYPEGTIAEGGGAGFYPRSLAVVWVILGIILALGSLRRKEETWPSMPGIPRRFLVFLVILLSFPYILGLLGFLATSFLSLLIFVSILKPREGPWTIRAIIRWILTPILIAGVATTAIYALLWWGVKIPLPKGELFSFGILGGDGIIIWSF